MRILLVEDDAELRVKLESSLNSQQYVTETAADGEEAMDSLFESSFDLIILDIMLPKTDGLTILNEMRSADISTPVLILSRHHSLHAALGLGDRRRCRYTQTHGHHIDRRGLHLGAFVTSGDPGNLLSAHKAAAGYCIPS